MGPRHGGTAVGRVDPRRSRHAGTAPRQRFETWTGLVHPDDLPWLLVEIDQAIRNRRVSDVEYRIRRPDGSSGWVTSRGRVLAGEDGEPDRMVGTVWDTTESRTARDLVRRALRNLSEAFFAVDSAWRITFVNPEAERLLGTSYALLGRILWDALADIGVDAMGLGLEAAYRRAVDSGTPGGFDVRWPTNRRWYHMRLVPMTDGLTVYLADVTENRSQEAESATAERVTADRNARISELTGALAEALTMQDVVTATAERVMAPFGASGLVFHLIEDTTVRVAGAVGYPQSFLATVDGVPVSDIAPIDEVHRTREPTFVDSAEEYIERYPERAISPASVNKAAWAFLPLIVSGRLVGCCVISFTEPRHLGGEERGLLITLSGLMAQAIERARLFDAEHTRAQELQRGLLPDILPALPAVASAARYLPANEGVEVGGDWYDVIPLSGARVALVIGDVMGHGLAQAATMGRLRTAVHTLADLDFPPDELLNRLNDVVNDLGDDFYATCLYAVYDPVTRTCTFGSAGHPHRRSCTRTAPPNSSPARRTRRWAPLSRRSRPPRRSSRRAACWCSTRTGWSNPPPRTSTGGWSTWRRRWPPGAPYRTRTRPRHWSGSATTSWPSCCRASSSRTTRRCSWPAPVRSRPTPSPAGSSPTARSPRRRPATTYGTSWPTGSSTNSP